MYGNGITRMIIPHKIGHFTIVLVALFSTLLSSAVRSQELPRGANLAVAAKSATSYVSGHETISALNDGFTPANSNDKSHGAYGNWPRTGLQWVEYAWDKTVSLSSTAIYWFDDANGVRLPKSARLLYWDGSTFLPIPDATIVGLDKDRFNTSRFPAINTRRIRLEFEGNASFSTGVLEWRVYDSGSSPNFPPTADAGVPRSVVVGAKTWLDAKVTDDGKPFGRVRATWHKVAGPGEVKFGDKLSTSTWASFAQAGTYSLELVADDGAIKSVGRLTVKALPVPPAHPLSEISMMPYSVSSPFWKARLKPVITAWIPHCVRMIEDPSTPEGGLDNFEAAYKKRMGEPGQHQTGAPFANAWVYNTLESMCLALMVDPQGDPEIVTSQRALHTTVDKWIKVILGAQEPDGYLHTATTIENRQRWTNKYDHEGYQAGYFIEAAIAHFQLTGGKDRRMYDAARRLADCWVRNIGPAPKRAWYDGHQELELALVRFSELVDKLDGAGKGQPYVQLARFLLDSRKGGDEYDQSHLPVTRQYEAVGHAVRAVYSYTGMAGVAAKTGDKDYHSAVQSLWDSIVNRKYYITGGVGSGETSEGFGKDYSLPVNAYCETCAGCGELFFQHWMELNYAQAKYADLMEETLFNAVLGGMSLDGDTFTYTNSLDSTGKRYLWHVCPCCVGNFARTLLRLPMWLYSLDNSTVTANLYAGSLVNLGKVAGSELQVRQQTNYPWDGSINLQLLPGAPAKFTLRLRIPDRQTSDLYKTNPSISGLQKITINGKPITPVIKDGYVVIDRTWKKGDTVALNLPLAPQRIHSAPQIAATKGSVAFKYGPIIYNFESVDQPLNQLIDPSAPMNEVWRPDLLGGIMALQLKAANGSILLGIPNYARLNRGGRSVVWLKEGSVAK